MYSTTVYLDRPIPAPRLVNAFASATGVAIDQVRTIARDEFERHPTRWFDDAAMVGLQTSFLRGDCPQVVDLVVRTERDLRAVLVAITRTLDVAALTDEFDVNPYSDIEWLMIAPDGSGTVIHTDADEFGADDPAISLEPDSRAIYDAKRRLAIGT